MNVLSGPESASDSAKFFGGFIGGAIQYQLGRKVNATIGGLAGSLFTSSYNEFISKSNLDMNALIRVGLSTAIGTTMGALGDYTKDADAIGKIQMTLLGADIDLGTMATFYTAKAFGFEFAGGPGKF